MQNNGIYSSLHLSSLSQILPTDFPLRITSDIPNHRGTAKSFSKHENSLNLLQKFLCFSLKGQFHCKIYGPEWQYPTPEE